MNSNITILRALAIILVVFGHSIILYDPSWGIYKPAEPFNFFRQFKAMINVVQMPLFISLSGYLFYYTRHKDLNISQFFKKKILRIGIPFLAITLLWMDPIKILLNVPGYRCDIETLLFQQLLCTNIGHLWFLPCLMGIFIFAYFFFRLKTHYLYDFILFIIVLIINIFAKYLPSVFTINMIGTFFLYFYVGFLANKYQTKFKVINNNLILLLLMFALWIIGKYAVGTFYISLIVSLFLVVVYNIEWNFNILDNEFMRSISTHSFGLYLFHSPLIYFTFTYMSDCHPLLVALVNFVGMGMIAFILTSIMKKNKLKILIGE